MRRETLSKWSKRGEHINIPNVPCILPPNTQSPLLHSMLLRARFEEIQYQLANLERETSNIINFDSVLSLSNMITYNSEGYRNDNSRNQIRARDSLFKERKNLLSSIDTLYPAFRVPGAIRIAFTKCTRKFYLNNPNMIGFILGPRGASLKQMESELGVHVSIRGKGSNPNPKAESEQEQDSLHALIESDTEKKIDECIKRLEQLLIPLPDNENERKKQQLTELARLRGHVSTASILEDPGPKKNDNPPWYDESLKFEEPDEIINEVASKIVANIDQAIVQQEKEEANNYLQKYRIDLDKMDLSLLVPEPQIPGLEMTNL
ncbi:KH domain containing protein [Tritrichomonas foetus]|uniref:Branchpoint-bridging protein n=1 Tax=Tritrichomonas foetus TaxID=1144522 RepID=A0A1J4KNI0_9EUKA|nr:KH domain containing protein [Tritrichomonas foetus]|eukprot:OHT11348.1 KH domain containing protein [Tritrichomonas foetus]